MNVSCEFGFVVALLTTTNTHKTRVGVSVHWNALSISINYANYYVWASIFRPTSYLQNGIVKRGQLTNLLTFHWLVLFTKLNQDGAGKGEQTYLVSCLGFVTSIEGFVRVWCHKLCEIVEFTVLGTFRSRQISVSALCKITLVLRAHVWPESTEFYCKHISRLHILAVKLQFRYVSDKSSLSHD